MNAAERKLVQEPAEAALRKAGWIVYRLKLESAKGWPDTTAARNGRVVFIEFKEPGGGVVSPHQSKLHQELREANVEVYVASSLDDIAPLLSTEDG